MKKLLFLFFFPLASALYSQSMIPSNTYVRTCLNDIECSSINASSHIYYDDAKEKFYLKIDFNAMKTGQDSVDFWLEDLDDTYFYFKASLPRAEFPNLSSYNTKNFKMDGQAFLNGVWRHQVIDMTIYRAENDLMNNSTNGNKFDAYKVNFSFSFVPKSFNVHKKPQRLTNTVFVGVGAGQINILRSGMEGQVGEAYAKD
jgi:hypothetical protein